MLCLRCGKKVSLVVSYCNRCFVFIIEKRLRKALRDSGLLRPGVKLYPENTSAKTVLQKVVNMPVVYVKNSGKNVVQVNLDTLDDTNAAFLAEYLSIKQKKKKEKKTNYINLFQHITDDEAIRYFSLLNKKYKPKTYLLKKYLQTFFAKYPETRYALHQASEEYSKISK